MLSSPALNAISLPLSASTSSSSLTSPSRASPSIGKGSSNVTSGFCPAVSPIRTSKSSNQISASFSSRVGGAHTSRLVTPTSASGSAMTSVEASAEANSSENLLNNPLLARTEFPLFDLIKADHIVPGIRKILATVDEEFSALEQSVQAAQPTWASLVEPLERIGDYLSIPWGAVNHLKAVKDYEEFRKAVEEVQPEVISASLRLSQSLPIFNAFKAMKEEKHQWESLSRAQQRAVEIELRSALLSGVALEGEKKERFNAIQQELASLSLQFSNNVLDSTKAFSKLILDERMIEGLPATARGMAAQAAKNKGHESATAESGPWLLTLDMPMYLPVMQHCTNRELRRELYLSYIRRASSGETDNAPLIHRILSLRREKAKLLGFESHAHAQMEKKMANLETAEKLLEELREASWDASVREFAELKDFASSSSSSSSSTPSNESDDSLLHWDVTFWSERLREAKYDLKEEELRPYFSFPRVMEGLFALAERLFAVTIEEADGQAPVWNSDVRFFRVVKAASGDAGSAKGGPGETVAFFYLDPYSRPSEKRGGAWMDSVYGRRRLGEQERTGEKVERQIRLPVAHMVCNQSPPVGEQPSLMTFREVETLFHEFGHALQHMLTQQSEGMVSGINGVEWDAVELPSQFMENWCYHRPTLLGFAHHFETGEPLPSDMFDKLLSGKNFRSASMMMRQIHFACVDLELHSHRFDPDSETEGGVKGIFETDQKIAKRTLVLPPLPEDRFLCAFSHIFAGGYSAGYYSYKWAEVLSADAFSAFEEAGLDDEQAIKTTGRRFRDTVLALGGGEEPLKVFTEFRGREPSIEPLLRHSGLLVETKDGSKTTVSAL